MSSRHHGSRIFTVTAVDESEDHQSARCGELTLPGRKIVETPNFIAVGSRGVVPHVTPDVLLQHTSLGGVHMALEDCKNIIISQGPMFKLNSY
jgi:queuine tRNA-ribosyltransferase subunit QTRTD1